MSRFTGKPLRLAIVNDYEIVVAGIARMLADHRDRVVVCRAGEPENCAQRRGHHPV